MTRSNGDVRFSFLVKQHRLVYSPPMKRFLALFVCLLIAGALIGCGAASESAFSTVADSTSSIPESSMQMPAMPAAAVPQMAREVVLEKEVLKEVSSAAFATEGSVEMAAAASASSPDTLPSLEEVQASVAAQERIIVREVVIDLVVDNVPQTVDLVATVAQQLGGWTVSSDRSSVHRGRVAIRVPAQDLEEAIRQLRALAIRVESELSNSRDVTDEYVDSSSRLRSLRATEESLLNLLTQANDVEDALEVQRELAQLQAQIESLEGRIKFLQQTAAFSLINVNLSLAPQTMTVDAGPDQTFSADQPARFRATFNPPAGIEDFNFTWDFGDGARVEGTGSAPTTQPGQRVTATVNHVFEDDRDSPYIVQLEITGTGQAGIVEGSDTLIATVTRIPTIEVFAGESRVVDEGEEIEYSGSFTRPEGLWDIQYRWAFGDGSPTAIGAPEEGATRAVAIHTYENYRPQAYEVTLTVTAQSEAGEVKDSGSFYVDVRESQGLIVGNWNLADSAKWAIRALSAVALAIVNILIWIAIFSPVWLALAAIGYGLLRLNRMRRARRDSNRPPQNLENVSQASDAAPSAPEQN